MNLLHALDEQGIGEGLPTIERLQLLSDEQLKGVLPTRGLTKRLREALAKHGLLPLAKNLVTTENSSFAIIFFPRLLRPNLDGVSRTTASTVLRP